MKIIDAHVHTNLNKPYEKPCPEQLVKRLDEAKVFGACIYSSGPKEMYDLPALSFEKRVEEVLGWTTGYEHRLFPILWIHPYEDNILENVRLASEKGIAAFKIICNNFYAGDDKNMQLMAEIAKLGKPVFFHSGILWDGRASSKYNRPMNWEELICIDGLRFSMAHCSWPWVDECIALYGKLRRSKVEMYIDFTPGAPTIYQENMFYKLFNIGYDIENNIMYGTDGPTFDYPAELIANGIKNFNAIFKNLKISKEIQQKIYCDNVMRFLGKDI